MKAWALGPSLLACVLSNVAHAQQVTSFADVAGSWRGRGVETGIDMTIVIGQDGSWTTSSKMGSETGKGWIKDGVFLILWPGTYGKMEITRAGADGITAKSQWYNGSQWVNSQLDAKRCEKPDCTDSGPKDYK